MFISKSDMIAQNVGRDYLSVFLFDQTFEIRNF